MKHIRDKELAKRFQGSCIICGQDGNGDHILNFKRIPSRDAAWNMWTLCLPHHQEKEKSLALFTERHSLGHILDAKGFYWIEENNKWWHKSANYQNMFI